ncbi:MAG: SUMF1/EgtB/PvdO family nonheme iron enzyme [Pseudomonadota bacterium]
MGRCRAYVERLAGQINRQRGLFDLGGNVMERVQHSWRDSDVRALSDGSAWVNPGCDGSLIRGASCCTASRR